MAKSQPSAPGGAPLAEEIKGVTSKDAGAHAVQTPVRGVLWETPVGDAGSRHLVSPRGVLLRSEGLWRVESGGHEACAPRNMAGAGESVVLGHALPLTPRGSETRSRTGKMKLVLQGNTEDFSTAESHDQEKERATCSTKSDARSLRAQKPSAVNVT